MAKLGTVRRIQKEDLARSGELPNWVDPLIVTLNQFMDSVVVALAGRISFADNIQCKVITQDFVSGTELVVNPQSSLKPIGIIPIMSQTTEIDSWKMSYKSSGQVGITLTFVGGGTQSATVIILF